jgi:HK97 family phage portal protein
MGLASRLRSDISKRDLPATQGGWITSRMEGWGDDTYTEKAVTLESAVGLTAVYSAVRIKSEDIGSLPLLTYRRRRDGGRERATGSSVYRLLHDRPNPEMTAMDVWTYVALCLNTHGNAYIGKVFEGNRVVELWPIKPDRVTVRRVNGRKVYDIQGDTKLLRYDDSVIIHIKGLSTDGLTGLSPIAVQRQAVSLGLALDEYVGRLMANRAVPSGVISTKKELSVEAAREVRKKWDATYRGTARAGKVAVLDEEAKFEPISLSLADAQFVQLHDLTVKQVARIFRLPASKLLTSTGDSMTYNTVESDDLHYVKHSLRTDLVRIEQGLASDRDLFPPAPTAGGPLDLYPEFLVDALLRGDSASRATYYSTATGKRPWMLPSEVRELENLPASEEIDQLPPTPDALALTSSSGTPPKAGDKAA